MPTYYPATIYGGPIWSVHSLCKELASQGHKVIVATTNLNGKKLLDVKTGVPNNIDGVEVYYFPVSYLKNIYFSKELKDFIKKEIINVDFLHIHSIFNWLGVISAKYAKKNGVPFCISTRGALVRGNIEQKSKIIKILWLKLFDKKNLEKAEFIHVTSPQEKIDILNFNYKYKSVEIIPNGINQINLNSNLKLKNDIKRILYLGRISWKKRINLILESMQYLDKYELVIAGNDDEQLQEKLIQFSRKLNILNRVKFVGPIYGDEKFELLNSSDLLVLVSENENFGNVVLEAMICSTAVAVTEKVGISYYLKANNTGFILPENSKEIANSIKKIFSDETNLKHNIKRGFNMANNLFAWKKISSDFESKYLKYI